MAPGTNFTGQPVVTAKDANGNAVSGVAVTLGIAVYNPAGGGDRVGTLTCTTTGSTVTTLASGLATFGGCNVANAGGRNSAGTYTFNATATGGLTVTSTGSVTIT